MPLIFGVELPPDTAADVKRQELKIFVGGSADPIRVVEDVEADTELAFNRNDQVHLELVFVDNDDNRSEARSFDFVALDKIAPPQPGEFGVRALREDPDVPPIVDTGDPTDETGITPPDEPPVP